jgi:hypothetical protein
MNSEIIAALIAGAVAVFCGLVGWMWSAHSGNVASARATTRRVTELAAELTERLHLLEKAHLAFKLDVAEKYASIPYLKDVEDRLIESLDKLADLVDRLRESMVAGLPPPPARRRPSHTPAKPSSDPA